MSRRSFNYTPSDSSELDAEAFDEEHRRNLEMQNSSLLKENNVLKAQFETAVNVGQRVEDVYKANEKLSNKVRDLTAENHSLKKRLEVNQRRYEEELKVLRKERDTLQQQQAYNEEAVKLEISKYKKKINGELKNAYEQNNR